MNLSMDRALSALIGAALAGGLATATGILVAMAAPTLAYGPPSVGDVLTVVFMGAIMVAMLAIYTSFVFAVGLFLLGLPAWAVLHRLGWRGRRTAVVAGAVLAGAAAGGLALALNGPVGGSAGFAAWMVLPGAVAGWTLHRIAYGKTRRAAP